MQTNIEDLVKQAGLTEPLYPGKKLVKKYAHPGEFKSHCVVFDWRDSNLVKIELKAGLSGKNLALADLKNYPVSYQAPTHLHIEVANQNASKDEDEDEEGERGSSGGGGKKPAVKELEDLNLSSANAFGKVSQGIIADVGEIVEFVVMGKELAKEAYGAALDNLKAQLKQAKVMAMDLLKGVDNVIQRATPGGGLAPKGNEAIQYEYNVEKTNSLFGAMTP